MPIKLFQTNKDYAEGFNGMLFFNNKMYCRSKYPKVHWWVWTDTVGWQYVSDLNTIKLLNESFEAYIKPEEYEEKKWYTLKDVGRIS